MKKSLPFFALALFAAGCTTKDYSSSAKSPWSYEGTDSGPNPLAALATVSSEKEETTGTYKSAKQYSWDKDKKVSVKKTTEVEPPEDTSRLRITDINGDYGLVEFVTTDKPSPKEVIVITDDRSAAARIRIVEVGAKRVAAEILPNQASVPNLVKGAELRFFKEARQ